VLEGITRRTSWSWCSARIGLRVVEREIDRSEIYVADEAFFCGTGVQVVAIASVDHRPIGTGHASGQITSQLRDLYFRVVRGEEPNYAHWLTPVYDNVASKPVAVCDARYMHQFKNAVSRTPVQRRGRTLSHQRRTRRAGKTWRSWWPPPRSPGSEQVLDAGSGAGHTALAWRPTPRRCQPSILPRRCWRRGGGWPLERGLTNITFQVGDVEALTFADASFDVVASRYSAHHWPHPQRALAEFRRAAAARRARAARRHRLATTTL
jgi:hypothetical protein